MLTVVVMAACQPQPEDTADLPTLAQLPTLTPSHTPSVTPTPTITPTPLVTFTPSVTATSTITPSLTITNTATPTETPSPIPTPEPNFFDELATFAATFTIAPTLPPGTIAAQLTASPTPFGFQDGGGGGIVPLPSPGGGSPGTTTCAFLPPGGFGVAFQADPALAAQIGCPLATMTELQASAAQAFERGSMLWVSGPPGVPGTIYAVYNIGVYQTYTDTYIAGIDPDSGGEIPPPGLFEPVRGFGKVWRTVGDVRSNLGWATTPESATIATLLRFERGLLLHTPARGNILVLIASQPGATTGSWRVVPGSP